MKTYLISYDLRDKTYFDYTKLIEYIKSYGTWAKPLESLWLIKTDEEIGVVRDNLSKSISSGDKIIVIEITGMNWATFAISDDVTDWMQRNV